MADTETTAAVDPDKLRKYEARAHGNLGGYDFADDVCKLSRAVCELQQEVASDYCVFLEAITLMKISAILSSMSQDVSELLALAQKIHRECEDATAKE